MERKKKKITVEEKTMIIGIGGIGDCVGTTHFSVMMSNYLAGFRRESCAMMEWNRKNALHRMECVCTGKNRMTKPFRVLDVDYYKESGPAELADVMKKGYRYLIVDLGDVRGENWTEFLRCDVQFLIGSFSEWKQNDFREFECEKLKDGQKSWRSLAVFGSEETRRDYKKRFHIFTDRIPFSADAFSVTQENRDFFEKIMEKQMTTAEY